MPSFFINLDPRVSHILPQRPCLRTGKHGEGKGTARSSRSAEILPRLRRTSIAQIGDVIYCNRRVKPDIWRPLSMPRIRLQRTLSIFLTALFLSASLYAADTIPNQIDDEAFWKFIAASSESGGAFQSENFLSNETGFQAVIPALKELTKPGGVYMGVGPEQNFTYIAAIRPKIAFIIDFRPQNMLEHMIYKVLFELSSDRADFI